MLNGFSERIGWLWQEGTGISSPSLEVDIFSTLLLADESWIPFSTSVWKNIYPVWLNIYLFFFSAELHLKYWRVLSCFSSVVPALNSNTWIQRFLLGYFSKCLKILFTVFQTAFNWPISFMSDINCLLDGTLLIKKNCFILQKILLLHSHMDFKNKF